MKKVLSFLLCLFLANAAHAQGLRIDSTRFYCNGNPTTFSEITDIIQTKDGGFFFTGRAGKPGGGILPICPGSGANPVMGKLDSLGNIEWIKNFCDTPGWATTVCQTADGGYAINGGSNSWNSMSIFRYDAQGNYLWRRDYGKNANSGTNKIIATPDKGFLMLGFASDRDSDILVTYDYPPKAFYTIDWVLIKLDSLGNKQWVRTLGTSGEEYTSAVLVCDSSNYYFIGDTESKDHDCADVAGHPGDAIYIIKLDSAGNVLWSKARGVGDVSQVLFDARDNSIMVTGKVNGGGHEMANIPGFGSNDIFLMKIDTAANYQWGNIFGTPNYERDGATLCFAPNNGYFVAGSNYGGTPIVYSGLLISIDSNGQLLQQRQITGQNGFLARYIFPFKNSYGLFGESADLQAPEGVGQNCSTSTIYGSRALTLSKLAVIPLGIKDIQGDPTAFTLSPNPTHESVTVRFEATHPKGSLIITTAEGKGVMQQNVGANESNITLLTTAWPPGAYLVCWQPQGKASQCQKLLVQ